ncbi:MAG: DUF5063 domain-containing protein [Nocardiopsaceae bacterium]|jgi:hypothetical protein|nr:DUF5063 domain-containing protein [Nocardiopsaceae bacterium]
MRGIPAQPRPGRRGSRGKSAGHATPADTSEAAAGRARNGSAAHASGHADGDWRVLADQVAKHSSDFLDALTAVGRGEGGDEVIPLLLLQVAQVMLAGAQLGASKDVIPSGNAEPDIGADPDLDELRVGLAKRLGACDEYAELFDPYRDSAPTSFRLSDDLAAMASDLIHGLQHYQAGRSAEALWWWQYSYVNQWGTHGGAALRALHAVVAHARLDVAEEEIPG